MADQANAYTEYSLLAEFVDDAGGAKARAAAAEETASAMRELVRRMAEQTGPKFLVAEVVERVVAATGKAIEDLVRQQIQVVLREYRCTPPIAAK